MLYACKHGHRWFFQSIILKKTTMMCLNIARLYKNQYTCITHLTSTETSTELPVKVKTYEIFPKGANAALTSSVAISGLKSPTNT